MCLEFLLEVFLQLSYFFKRLEIPTQYCLFTSVCMTNRRKGIFLCSYEDRASFLLPRFFLADSQQQSNLNGNVEIQEFNKTVLQKKKKEKEWGLPLINQNLL